MLYKGETTATEERAPVLVRRAMFKDQEEQLHFLRKMVNEYKGNQLIRDKTLDVVFRWGACPAKSKLCQATTIARWVQENITYVNEGAETFQSPVRTLTSRFGDCDDFCSLIASMIEAVGIPSQVVGLKWLGSYRHVFPRAVIAVPGRGLQYIPLDATLNQDVRTLPNPITISIKRGDNPTYLAV